MKIDRSSQYGESGRFFCFYLKSGHEGSLSFSIHQKGPVISGHGHFRSLWIFRWSRVDKIRENNIYLFLCVIFMKNVCFSKKKSYFCIL